MIRVDKGHITIECLAISLGKFIRNRKMAKFSRLFLVGLLSLWLLCATMVHALPPGFQDEIVLSGLQSPVNLAVMPDGRMLVLLKGGGIKIFDPVDTPATAETYMVLSNIEAGGERGLTSLVLDPEFLTNGYFYVYYTHGSTFKNRVSRFSHSGDTADPDSELVIWEDNENWSACCHYGGGLDFGPDGYLYLSTGEEFDGQQSQDLTRAGGKIIRIRKDGTIPNDNPFVDGPGGNLDEIWALGLRNPYRAKWDTIYNKYFFGDVGGNVQSSAREEVNVGVWGGNFGWPNCEGLCGIPQYIEPVYDYGHTGQTPNGGAVTLGPVYRGNLFPNQYFGNLFIADYVLGWIKYLELDNQGNFLQVHDFDDNVNNVVALIQGPEGALYYVDVFGQVRRITYISGNQPPQISDFQASVVSGSAPLEVTFNVVASDVENGFLTYHWIFGDGVEVDGDSDETHTYSEGVFTAYALVSDGNRSTISEPIEIQSGNPPVVSITSPQTGALFRAGDIINFAGQATDIDETLSDSNFSWTVRFIHNAHVHPVLNDYNAMQGQFTINDSGHDYFDFTGYELILTVTDSAGLTGTDSVEIYPDKVNLNFDTVPQGRSIFIDGIKHSAPIVYDSMIGFKHTISASGYCDGNTNTLYEFSSWSDGGGSSHEIIVPTADINLTAYFTAVGPCSTDVPTANLELWLEASSGVSTSSSQVTGWNGIFGNNLTSSGDPQLVISPELGNRLVVDFDGTGDKLEIASGLSGLPAGNADRTVYLVANYRGVGFGGFAYGNSACNQAFGPTVDNQGRLMAQGWCGSSDHSSDEIGTGVGWMIQSIVHKSGVMSHYKDGVLIDTQSHNYNTVLTNLVLGGELADNKFMDMQVAEVLVYSAAHSSLEHGAIIDSLLNKYSSTPELSLVSTLLPDGTENSFYSYQLEVSGGITPLTFNVTNGALPQGIQLNNSTGELSGMPSQSQLANFEITVTDVIGSIDTNFFSLLIRNESGGVTPSVNIVSPLDGAVIEGSEVLVNYNFAGDGFDHVHIRIDDNPHVALHNPTGTYMLTNVVPGQHVIQVWLVNAEHQALVNPESSATVNIETFLTPNIPPQAEDDLVAVEVGGSAQVAVLANDNDSDGVLDLTSLSIVSFPLHGTIVDDGTGVLTYFHDGGVDTSDSFTYTVMDNEFAVSNEATVSVVIGGVPVVSGLVFHLESDSGLGVNGGQVTSWSDLSGSGYTLMSSGDPQLVISPELGNRPVVDFDGTGDKLEIASGLSGLPAGNADRTVYLVANYRGVGFGGFAYGNSACNQAFGTTVDNQGRLMAQGWCGRSDHSSDEIGTGVGWMIQSIVHKLGVMSHYKDGVLIDTQSHNYNTVLTNLVLGGELADNKFMDMQVAAVLIFDRALDATEVQQVEAYLQNKY